MGFDNGNTKIDMNIITRSQPGVDLQVKAPFSPFTNYSDRDMCIFDDHLLII